MFWKSKKDAPSDNSEEKQGGAEEEQPQPQENAPEDQPEADVQEGWLSRMTGGLAKSSAKLGQGLTDFITKKKLDEETLQDLEDTLITADLGPTTAAVIIEDLRASRFGYEVDEIEIKDFLAGKITEILTPVAKPFDAASENKPYVVLVTGVNGVGKTTTIGKFAKHLQNQGKSVMLAAGDTFRAAAIEQLKIWGERNDCPVFAKGEGADPAAVAFEAYNEAKAQGADVLMIDTAGRLHNKADLMAELQKVVRVLKKHDEGLPHASLLVLDATTGQNAHSQLQAFQEMVDINGLIVTKLDGSAKGGVVVSLANHFKLPIHAIGVGEGIDDLQPFEAEAFAKALVGL